jgi:hypothetical protein
MDMISAYILIKETKRELLWLYCCYEGDSHSTLFHKKAEDTVENDQSLIYFSL